MKNLFQNIGALLLLFLFVFVGSASFSSAQEEKSSTPTSETQNLGTEDRDELDKDKLQKIEELKEKIATKVAEIRNEEKGAFFGSIIKTEDNSIVLETKKGQVNISLSEDTLFYTLSQNKLNEKDKEILKEGVSTSVFGYFGSSKDALSAKYIYVQDLPLYITGKIANIDNENFTLTVKTKQEEIVVDFEKYTIAQTYQPENNRWSRIGFSKLELGDIVHLVGTPHESEEDRMHADRISIVTSLTNTPEPTKESADNENNT